MDIETVKFKATLVREVYSGNGFAVYAVDPTENGEDLIKNEYGNVTIVGDIIDLVANVEYSITATKTVGKRGYQYSVDKIERPRPEGKKASKVFLQEILTENQANTLLEHYPDVIDIVMSGRADEIDTSKLFRIGQATMKKIADKIITNFKLIEIIDEYSPYGITLTMLKRLYDHYTSVDKLKKELKEQPYHCLCSLNGVGFTTADKTVIKMTPEAIGSYERMEACIEYIVSENQLQGHTYMEFAQAYAQAIELAPEASRHFTEVIKTNKRLRVDKETKSIAMTSAFKAEVEILRRILYFKTNNKELDIDCTKYSMVDNFPLTEEQMGTTANFCKFNFSMLEGWAGTGKSFSTSALIDLLEENELSYILLSPTGKASKVMAEYTGKDAYTIHRGLGYHPQDGFAYNEENPLDYDTVIVDEASMVDVFLMCSLMRAIDPERTRLVLIQDPAQIPSVGAGNVSHDLLESGKIPKTTLTQVFRYKEGGLARVCAKIREGKNYLPANSELQDIHPFGEKGDYIFLNTPQEQIVNQMVRLYKGLLDKGNSTDDMMVLSAYNVGAYGTVLLNNAIQAVVNPPSTDDDLEQKHELSTVRKKERIIFREGDKVLQIRNNYGALMLDGDETAVFNGNTGTIVKIEPYKKLMYIEFDGVTVVYEESDLGNLSLGYAISIHKSQGSSAKYVILVTPASHKFFLNRNLLYVGCTRGKEKVFHISSPDVVRSAIRKAENFLRNTYLGKLLTGKMHITKEELLDETEEENNDTTEQTN